MTRLRRCNKCREYKAADQYSHNHPWCLPCKRAATRASRLKKLEHYRAVNKAWNANHRAQLALAEVRRRYGRQAEQRQEREAA